MPLFFLLLIGVAIEGKALTARLLRSRMMRHIGLISYGLYLFHVPLVVWMAPLHLEGAVLFAAAFATTYLAAIASYLLIEKPFPMLKPTRHYGSASLQG